MFIDVLQPEIACIKAVLVGDIKANEDAQTVFVVHPRNLSKSFLASCVPHVNLHYFARRECSVIPVVNQLDCFCFKVPSNCRLIILRKALSDVPLNQARLPDHRFPHADYFVLLWLPDRRPGILRTENISFKTHFLVFFHSN